MDKQKNKNVRATVRLNAEDNKILDRMYHYLNKKHCEALGLPEDEENYSMNKSDIIRYSIRQTYNAEYIK